MIRGAIPVGRRSAVALVLITVVGVAMFTWPLLLDHGGGTAHVNDAPFLFALMLPALLAVVLAQLGEGGIDTKALAMLGVLSAVGAALRPLSAGTGGIELVFFLLVLAGRVYGPGFGFVLGSTTLFTSALLTAGVGPWLPFQMLAASWIGMGAGMLPAAKGRAERALLAVYGAIAAYVFGFLLNLWAWPFTLGANAGELSFVPGDAVVDNLHRFWLHTLASSTWGWDTGRAITNVVAILVLGTSVLATLRRSARRAAFGAAVAFEDGPAVEQTAT